MTQEMQCNSLAELLAPYAREANRLLEQWLVEPASPAALAEAMRYCALDGGKRLRPSLVLLTGEAFGDKANELAARAAVAVELVHCYSLVHDDLPAMDDDKLRRGRPTAHVKFGQAMAILAGDALLTRAFAVLGEAGGEQAAALVAELAHAAGPAGMVAGQVADMDLCEVPGGVEGLRYIHLNKTAALIRAAVRMGAMAAGADKPALDAVGRYGRALGLAFQLVDDLLDVTGSAEQIGKTPGKDLAAGKRTYVEHLGLDRARALADELTGEAAAAADALGPRGGKLRRLAELLGQRSH